MGGYATNVSKDEKPFSACLPEGHVVVEHLDFARKKAKREAVSRRKARMLSSLAYTGCCLASRPPVFVKAWA